MRAFDYFDPTSVSGAVELLRAGHGKARPIAGGSDLLGELKEGLVHYEQLVGLSRIEELHIVRAGPAGLQLGAGVTLAQLEREPRLSGPYRILAEAARGVATPEIRNQGTLGGNLCQRPRCLHYRSPWVSCLKKGGTGCPALASEHQPYLSVFGGAPCAAVHASDLAPPLLALDAAVHIAGAEPGPAAARSMPLDAFLAGPEVDVRRENVLSDGEILTAVTLPPAPVEWRGTTLKARERTAGDFPLVSVAFGCVLAEGRMRHVRMVLGGVAPVPRRCPEAQALLEGQSPSRTLADRAAAAAFAAAKPLAHNAIKLELGRALVARAIEQVAGAP